MSRVLIIPDVHLGKSPTMGKPGIGQALNSRIVDQFKLLDWVFDQAMEHEVKTLIFTGDICEDPKPDYILINNFLHFLKKCEIHDIIVHIILGNHDLKRTGNNYTSWLDIISISEFSNAHVHKQIDTIHMDGVCFTLLPFRDRRSFNCDTNAEALDALAERLPYELAYIPSNYDRVLVGHLALEGALYVGDEIDDAQNELLCPLNMFKGYDYVIMGHVHKPQILSKKPYICHVGSLDRSDFGETDHNKIIILFDAENKNKIINIDVPTRPLTKVVLSVPMGTNPITYITEQLNLLEQTKSFKDAIVKIEIKLMDANIDNNHRAAIEKTIYDLGAFHISNFSESKNIKVVSAEKSNQMDNTIIPKQAIKIWADQYTFDNEDDKKSYIAAALEIINEYQK